MLNIPKYLVNSKAAVLIANVPQTELSIAGNHSDNPGCSIESVPERRETC